MGFHLIDRLGSAAGISVDKKQHNAQVGSGRLWDRRVLLAKPTTFMNNSGKAVRKLMDYYKVPGLASNKVKSLARVLRRHYCKLQYGESCCLHRF